MNASSTARPIPQRVRPFEKTQGDKPLLRLLVGRNPAPSYAEWKAQADALWDGDEPVDKVLDWMFSEGVDPRKARAMYEQAVRQGVDTIPDAPEPLKEYFHMLEKDPVWLDRGLLEEGISFIHGAGLAGAYVLRDFALMGGYLLSGFNQALVMTGALNKGAAQRIAETGKWWIDCTEHHGLDKFGVGYQSTIRVRMVHALVRRNLQKKLNWDTTRWGLPVSQIDMVATYLAFGTVMLGGIRLMGIPVTPRESRAVMHLWKYAGWLMGVDEKWLVDTETEGMLLLYHTFMTQSQPDWTSKELGSALAKEPLERHFEKFESIRRKLAYHQHLSVSRFFLTAEQMKDLGLPNNVLPWFPVLTAGPRLVKYTVNRFVPGRKEKQEQEGRRLQLEALASMFGEKGHDIINPDINHPAHV